MDQNYTNAIFSRKNLRYPGKPGLTQAILPHSTQKHQQRVCQRMQSAQNTNILAKTFFFDVLSQNAQSEERYLCHRPIQKILFDAKFTKTKTQWQKKQFIKTHWQKPIHKQVGSEQDQRGQYLGLPPRWLFARFLWMCLFLGLDTWIILQPHNQSYKSSVKTNFTSKRQDPFLQ